MAKHEKEMGGGRFMQKVFLISFFHI